MPRRQRVHLPGGFYHVTLRGNHQRAIFFDDADALLLNDVVARAVTKYGARLHAYCWMSNHIHMLVEIAQAPLSCIMRQVGSEFARRMQWHMPTSGHFFERRYHATLIDTDRYLQAVVRYIHLNPVEARLVAEPAEYRWSSHHEYIDARHGSWITTDVVLRYFAPQRKEAVAAYRAFMDDRAAPEWGSGLEFGQESIEILGTEAFVNSVQRPLAPEPLQKLDDLIAEACRRFMVAENRLRSPVRDKALSLARAWIAQQARTRGVATLSEVARRLNRSEATLRQAVREMSTEEEAG